MRRFISKNTKTKEYFRRPPDCPYHYEQSKKVWYNDEYKMVDYELISEGGTYERFSIHVVWRS